MDDEKRCDADVSPESEEQSAVADDSRETSPPPRRRASVRRRAATSDVQLQHPPGAQKWRAREVGDDGRISKEPLFWGEDGVEADLFPIADASAATVRDRWGNGRYVLLYYGELPGKKPGNNPLGKSPVIQIKNAV